MSRSAPQKRIPWLDRWREPSVEELLQPLEEQRRKVIDNLMGQVEGFEDVERGVVWYGQSWRWTIEYTVPDAEGEVQTLAFLVPKPEGPVFVVPFNEELITKLPLRRLTKYVRDALRGAKRAVEAHWAMWTPSNNQDVENLADLIKRKHKLLRTPVADAGE